MVLDLGLSVFVSDFSPFMTHEDALLEGLIQMKVMMLPFHGVFPFEIFDLD